jgi:2-desacetyl-2-hydroxyethyl bacteriochlorophyllide A dehydrogenase
LLGAAGARIVKAAVFRGPGDVRFEEVEKPTLEEAGVLLRVRACGICGSDLHAYRHGMFQEILGIPVETGRILGHEFSGEIAEIRGDVTGVEIGDRVITIATGANAEYIKLSPPVTGLLIPFDESTSFVEAATTEPLATSLHAVNLANPKEREIHVIMGAGIIGLGVLQCIKSRSSAKTIVVDLSDKRLAMATELGADLTLNAKKTDVLLEMMGSGQLDLEGALVGNVDTVFDCAGIAKSFEGTSVMEQALSMVKQDGKIIMVAIFEKAPEIEWNLIVRKGIKLLGSWAWTPEEFVQASRLIRSGEIDRKPLISHTFPLEDAGKAYETQLHAEEAIKVVLTP